MLVERVQHRFTWMIPGFAKLSYPERLECLGSWSLDKRRNRADLIEMFKMDKGLCGIWFESMFEGSSTKHLRGHEYRHRANLDVPRYFFTEQLIGRWNSLDHQTLNASTVNGFKSGLSRLRKS